MHGGSCNGLQACSYLGMNIVDGASISVGRGSCNGNEATCYAIAEQSKSPELVVNIDDNTCIGYRACQFAGKESKVLKSLTVNADSCHGDRSCFEIDRTTTDLEFLQIYQIDDDAPITVSNFLIIGC